jgi:gas vesicle protein
MNSLLIGIAIGSFLGFILALIFIFQDSTDEKKE